MKIIKRLRLLTVILMISVILISCNTENTDKSISDKTSSENKKTYTEKIDNTFPLLIGKNNEKIAEYIEITAKE
ncbi:MAG: hypothetical protein E7484_03515 [Ruminococcaceae bacterium]|nr:hypothetical protein [Oscillospiraceae bacterium]